MTNKSQESISATEQEESNTKKLPFAFCCTMALQKVAKKWDDMAKVQKLGMRNWPQGQNFQTSSAVYYGARPIFEEARK